MKALKLTLLFAALVFANVTRAQTAVWDVESWAPCDVIASPLGTTLTEVQHTLAAKGVIGAERQGSAMQGNFAMTFKDAAKKNVVQLTFDTDNRLDAASTWYTAADAAAATTMLNSLTSDIEQQGGKRLDEGTVDLTDGSVSYVLNCAGTERTVTVGRNADQSNVVWLVVSR